MDRKFELYQAAIFTLSLENIIPAVYSALSYKSTYHSKLLSPIPPHYAFDFEYTKQVVDRRTFELKMDGALLSSFGFRKP